MNDDNMLNNNSYYRQKQQSLSIKMTKSIIHHYHHPINNISNDDDNNMICNSCSSNDDIYNNNNNYVDIINFTDDIHLGYNYFFIDSINSKIWHISHGTYLGQNIQIRKISCQDFNYDVNIYIKHQDLSCPNNKSCIYILKVNKYFISFSWSGKYWMLEYCQ